MNALLLDELGKMQLARNAGNEQIFILVDFTYNRLNPKLRKDFEKKMVKNKTGMGSLKSRG
jgi:hypothetical protein